MVDATGSTLRQQLAALERRLAAPGAPKELDALKLEIAALFKQVEHELADLTAVRDAVKQLVERWKAVRTSQGGASAPASTNGAVSSPAGASKSAGSTPSIAPQFSVERPLVHADHIGASTFIEKGWSRLSLGEPKEAESALRKALELSPDAPEAEALLGWALMLQDKFDDALLMFQKVLMRQPQNALARINVGYICLKKRIFGEAIEHLSRAIRLGNDRKATLYAHFYLGLVYLERDMFEDAQTFFQKTLVLGPNLIEAYYELGRAYWFNGQRDEAMETWRRGHAANRLTPWGKRCAEVLATVEKGGEP